MSTSIVTPISNVEVSFVYLSSFMGDKLINVRFI